MSKPLFCVSVFGKSRFIESLKKETNVQGRRKKGGYAKKGRTKLRVGKKIRTRCHWRVGERIKERGGDMKREVEKTTDKVKISKGRWTER